MNQCHLCRSSGYPTRNAMRYEGMDGATMPTDGPVHGSV